MPVNRPARNLGSIGDIRKRGVSDAACSELPDSRFNQLLPGFLSLFFLFPRHKMLLVTHRVTAFSENTVGSNEVFTKTGFNFAQKTSIHLIYNLDEYINRNKYTKHMNHVYHTPFI